MAPYRFLHLERGSLMKEQYVATGHVDTDHRLIPYRGNFSADIYVLMAITDFYCARVGMQV
jgi:hypothetical protein